MTAKAWKLDAALAELAMRQHGAVGRDQLLALGFTRHSIEHRIATGVLLPVHRGVYLVRPARALAREAAAVLACRPRAMLNHSTSARLWGLPVPADDWIRVTVVGRWRRSLDGVRVDSVATLSPGELRRHDRLPIASPALTLLDLAGSVEAAPLVAALNEARVQRIVTDRELRASIEAHPHPQGRESPSPATRLGTRSEDHALSG